MMSTKNTVIPPQFVIYARRRKAINIGCKVHHTREDIEKVKEVVNLSYVLDQLIEAIKTTNKNSSSLTVTLELSKDGDLK
jgi:hypothetical protein